MGTYLCGDKCIADDYDTKTCDGVCIENWELRQKDYKNNSKWTAPCDGECHFGFKCQDGSACLTLGAECDGVKDCPDGSDEDKKFCNSCGKYQTGGQGDKEFHCLTEPQYGRCSDDKNYYLCGDKCILKTQFCPETKTCFTTEICDDTSCYPRKKYDDFSCDDQTCVDGKLRCNGAR